MGAERMASLSARGVDCVLKHDFVIIFPPIVEKAHFDKHEHYKFKC